MDYPTHPLDIDAILLIEFDGALRRDVPEELRDPRARFVVLRRYVSAAQQKEFARAARECERRYTYPDGATQASEEHIAERDALLRRKVAARLIEWNYTDAAGNPLPCTEDALLQIPAPHLDALGFLVRELELPRSDEEAFRLGLERRRRSDERSHDADNGARLADRGVVAAHGAALPEAG